MLDRLFFVFQGDLHHWLKYHWWWCQGTTNQNQEFSQVGSFKIKRSVPLCQILLFDISIFYFIYSIYKFAFLLYLFLPICPLWFMWSSCCTTAISLCVYLSTFLLETYRCSIIQLNVLEYCCFTKKFVIIFCLEKYWSHLISESHIKTSVNTQSCSYYY